MNKKWLYLALLASPTALADNLVNWWDVSVTGLYGTNYKLGGEEQTTVTIETAGDWKYGDWFAFHDFAHYNGEHRGLESTNYGEISPRFSFGKMSGQDLSLGPIKDFSLAFTLESGYGDVDSFLYGLGTDIAIPGFSYFSLNAYKRYALSNKNNSDGWQLTPAFRIDLPVGNSNIVFDGFIDWVFKVDNEQKYSKNLHFNPQIKYDLGQVVFADQAKNKLLVGIEYDYWRNKYGVDGINQSTYSVIAKYHF